MKYFEIELSNWFSCSFTIAENSYRAEFRKLSSSERYIWSVRNINGVEIFKSLYVSEGVNYADMFADFEHGTILKVVSANGRQYLATE